MFIMSSAIPPFKQFSWLVNTKASNEVSQNFTSVKPRSVTQQEATDSNVDTFESSVGEEQPEVEETNNMAEKLNKYQREKLNKLMKKRTTLICSAALVGGLLNQDPRKKLKDSYKNPIISFITGAALGTGIIGAYSLLIKYLSNQTMGFIPKFSKWDLILVPFALFGGFSGLFAANDYNKAVSYLIKKNGNDAKVEDVLKQISGLEGTKEELKLKD